MVHSRVDKGELSEMDDSLRGFTSDQTEAMQYRKTIVLIVTRRV